MTNKTDRTVSEQKSEKRGKPTTSSATAKYVPMERKLFARNFRQARKAADLSQDDVRDLTGFSKSYISDLELCKVNISIDKMSTLAQLVGISLQELLKP